MEGSKYRHPNHGNLPTIKDEKPHKKEFSIFYEKPKQRSDIDIDRPRDPKDKLLTVHDLELYQREFIQPLIDRIDDLERELYNGRK